MKGVAILGAMALVLLLPLSADPAPAAPDWAAIAATNRQAVVEIEVKFLGSDNQVKEKQGTGFAILDGGYVLTNHHLLQYKDAQLQAITASVGSREGARYQMRVVKSEDSLDLSLLVFVNAPPGLLTVRRGNSGSLRSGDPVVAVGFPDYAPGNDYRPATGTLTDVNADIGELVAGLEAEMRLYPGNSGGPLFNASGEVIGVVVSKLTLTTTGEPENRVSYFLRIEQANSLLTNAATMSGTVGIGGAVSSTPGELIRFPTSQQLSLADIPKAAFVPLQRAASLVDLRSALEKYPALDLTQDTLKIEGGDAPGQKTITIFLSTLRMDDSTLYVLNRDVVLVVGLLEVSRAHIRSFPSGVGQATSGRDASGVGEPGGSGANGAASGSLTIYAVERKLAQMDVDLAGQDGGRGGRGGPGVAGVRGRAGESGSDHLFDCARGPGDGERGGPGGDGAKGGRGGDGGNAGLLAVYVLEGAAATVRDINSSSKGGAPGEGGPGGVGGRGGDGGPRGANTTYCHGGSDGPPGPTGNSGQRGDDGAKGSDGAVRIVAPMSFDRFPNSWR